MSRYQLLPPLTDEEYAELEADIVANGVLQPILVDEHNVTIDGHHRKQIADKHGLRCPSIKCPPNLTDEAKRTLSFGINAHRRHMSNERKRIAARNSLMADPHLSDRQHAERVGIDHKTIASVRAELERGGELPHHATRTGKDGVAQPVAKVATTTRTTESTKVERDIDLETGEVVSTGGASIPTPEALPPVTPLDYDRDAEQEWEDATHPPRDEPAAVAAAVNEFPFLADYPRGDVLPTAEALRAIPEGPQRDRRIEAAKTWPAAVAAADDIAAAGHDPADDVRDVIHAIAETSHLIAGLEITVAEALAHVAADEADEWREVVATATERINAVNAELNQPRTLRRVK